MDSQEEGKLPERIYRGLRKTRKAGCSISFRSGFDKACSPACAFKETKVSGK